METETVQQPRKRGRPKGSKNKVQMTAAGPEVSKQAHKRGRPVGSKNKAKTADTPAKRVQQPRGNAKPNPSFSNGSDRTASSPTTQNLHVQVIPPSSADAAATQPEITQLPRKRGRPKGSKNKLKSSSAAAEVARKPQTHSQPPSAKAAVLKSDAPSGIPARQQPDQPAQPEQHQNEAQELEILAEATQTPPKRGRPVGSKNKPQNNPAATPGISPRKFKGEQSQGKQYTVESAQEDTMEASQPPAEQLQPQAVQVAAQAITQADISQLPNEQRQVEVSQDPVAVVADGEGQSSQTPRKRGRPKGSKNKAKTSTTPDVSKPPRKRGRPQGSKNAVKKASKLAGTSQKEHDHGPSTRNKEGGMCTASSAAVYERCLARAKTLISKLEHIQHSMNVHTADGWKGASREKVKLTVQMEELQAQNEKCKQSIIHCLAFCDKAEGDKPIASENIGDDGEVSEKDIFCSRCHDYQSHDGNDIILCDGPCNRAYHELCLQPRIHAQELSEDDPWLCFACNCKMEILTMINEVVDTSYDLETPTTSIFQGDPLASPRAKQQPKPGSFLHADFPSSDEEDEDFAAEASGEQVPSAGSSDSESESTTSSAEGGGSARSVASASQESEGLTSMDLLVGPHSPRSPGGDQQQSRMRRQRSARGLEGSNQKGPGGEDKSELAADDVEANSMLLAGKRRRHKVDYRALHDEMFGKSSMHTDEDEEDEDFEYDPDPYASQNRRS